MLTKGEQNKVLRYLKSGRVYAVAAGWPMNHRTGEYVKEDFLAFADGLRNWTTEDILNFRENDEMFSASVIQAALNSAQEQK